MGGVTATALITERVTTRVAARFTARFTVTATAHVTAEAAAAQFTARFVARFTVPAAARATFHCQCCPVRAVLCGACHAGVAAVTAGAAAAAVGRGCRTGGKAWRVMPAGAVATAPRGGAWAWVFRDAR